MGLPEANLTINDGGLGLVPTSDFGVVALIGTCSGGVPNTVYSFSDIGTLRAELGTGPMVEAAAHILSIAGGPVRCVKASGPNGTVGAVTHTGVGGSVCSVVYSLPLDSYQVKVLIVQGGANPASGTVTLKWSLDGGRTYSPEVALSTLGAYEIPNTGIFLSFSNLDLVPGDTYSFSTTGPAYNLSTFGAAFDALATDSSEFFLVYAVGVPPDAESTAGFFAALDTKLATAQNNFRFARGLMQSFDGTDAAIKAAVNGASTRVAIAAGFVNLVSPISGFASRRPVATVAAARAAKVRPSEDLGRVASGPLPGVVAVSRDEFKTPGLDAAGYITVRSHVGELGWYITNGRMKAAATSDFQFLQHCRVMDIAARAARRGQLRFLNDTIEVNPLSAPPDKAGRIMETEARRVETWIEKQMWGDLGREVQDLVAQVDRTANILSAMRMPIRFRVLPKAYAKFIDGEISLTNPALIAS